MLNSPVGRSPRWRGFGLVAVLLLVSFMPACSDSNPNVPNVPRSSIFVSVEPNPVIGVQNPLTGSVSAAYVVQIQELAGLGATVQRAATRKVNTAVIVAVMMTATPIVLLPNPLMFGVGAAATPIPRLM